MGFGYHSWRVFKSNLASQDREVKVFERTIKDNGMEIVCRIEREQPKFINVVLDEGEDRERSKKTRRKEGELMMSRG